MLRPHKRIRVDNNLSTNKIKSFTIDLSEFNNITTIDELLNILNVSQRKQTQLFINIDTLYNLKEPLIKLNNMIGLNEFKESIVNMILYYIQGLDNNEMFNTVLEGPPGCGKTEIAQILADIYSKLGKLSKGTFTSVKRHDLVAEYLGQTAIKTNKVLKDALGGVLFIDEAYSLGNSEKRDSFAKECIDTINHFLTENADDFVGGKVRSAGDVDGDEIPDILINAFGNADGGGSRAGKTYLILGSSLGSTSTVYLSNADYSFVGENGVDNSGKSVSSAGDVDGDGLSDFLIGA